MRDRMTRRLMNVMIKTNIGERFCDQLTSKSRNTYVFRNALMKMANGFTNIQCITAVTLVFINNARPSLNLQEYGL